MKKLLAFALFLLFTAAGRAAGQVTVNVDPDMDRHPVSPNIFGVAHFDDPGTSELPYPVRRWGGNATVRYNWRLDIQNRALSYFFLNIPNTVANPLLLPDGSYADQFIDHTKAHQGEIALTIPILGWVPKGTVPADRIRLWGCDTVKYAALGSQTQTECGYNPYMGCALTAGNCINHYDMYGNPVFISGPTDPADTSMAVTPAYFVDWMDHIISRVGDSGSGGVRYVLLDNEPMIWNFDHHDVHYAAPTYDEVWGKAQASALAFKTKDPGVLVMGPTSYGWCEYFYSGLDNCAVGPDCTGHGNIYWIPYFLKQAAAYEAANGIRLIDYLDLHYYPAAPNVTLSNDESMDTSAKRLRTLKSLYDPTYVDESWIGAGFTVDSKVNLIPRMRAWVNDPVNGYPGTKIAINEYNFGDGTTSSALAQAEALAIFGREGVDMANRWVVPDDDTLIEDAFKLYLNYDTLGSKVAGDSVRAISSNIDAVGGYALRDTALGRVYVLLFNKDIASTSTTVNFAGQTIQQVSLYRFSGTQRLGPGPPQPFMGGSFTASLPARSATLAVVDVTCSADIGAPTVTAPGPVSVTQTVCQ